jgi:ATP-dependent RNA helicase DeaD
MSLDFIDLGLHQQSLQVVDELGFKSPTPIQESAIPVLLNGQNVLGQAQTGTGKTAAFVLPMLQQINAGSGKVQALILTPTRELAVQVAKETKRMSHNSRLKVATIYGGQAYSIQIRQLESGADVVVGTTGRLLDLIRKKKLDLSEVNYLVLDEADEMLEMGFIHDVEDIMAEVPKDRQIALFSATMPKAVRNLAEKYINDPQEIIINPSIMTVAETEQRYYLVKEDQKFDTLVLILESEGMHSALIFSRTKRRAQKLSDRLIEHGFKAKSMHGDLSQANREQVLEGFKKHKIVIMVATDVAARGLDIEKVSHVINYDLPMDPESYVHRIGRTGRAGQKGIAISFITIQERKDLQDIERFTHQKIEEFHAPSRTEINEAQDDKYIKLIAEQIKQGNLDRERRLVSKMVDSDMYLWDVAAAAIQVGQNQKKASEPEKKEYVNDQYEKRPIHQQNRNGKKTGRFERNNFGREPKTGEAGMVRLKLNLGKRHGLRPQDVVGAIASEAGVPGYAVGKISIFPNHTLVDISEQHTRKVIQKSNGQYSLYGIPVKLHVSE